MTRDQAKKLTDSFIADYPPPSSLPMPIGPEVYKLLSDAGKDYVDKYVTPSIDEEALREAYEYQMLRSAAEKKYPHPADLKQADLVDATEKVVAARKLVSITFYDGVFSEWRRAHVLADDPDTLTWTCRWPGNRTETFKLTRERAHSYKEPRLEYEDE